jgi:hypothetical protein
MLRSKKQKYLLFSVTVFFVLSIFSYAISFDEIKEKVEARVDDFGEIVFKMSHPTSTYKSTELYSFRPYSYAQTGYDANSNSYDYNVKVVFLIRYKGWVRNHRMMISIFFNYLMPKDIKLESDSNAFKPFGLNLARQMIADIKSELN